MSNATHLEIWRDGLKPGDTAWMLYRNTSETHVVQVSLNERSEWIGAVYFRCSFKAGHITEYGHTANLAELYPTPVEVIINEVQVHTIGNTESGWDVWLRGGIEGVPV